MAFASSSFTLSTPPSSASFPRRPVSAAYSTAERTSTISSVMSSQTSLYEILGIQTDATGHEIKSAYRRLARTLHPDVVRFQQDSSAEEFIRVQSAYATLSDPEKRANYDRKLLLNRIRRTVDLSSMGARGNYTVGRNWETDQCW